MNKMDHSLKRCSSPDWSMRLIQRQGPFEAVVCGGDGGGAAPLLLPPMYAISKPFPTGRNTDLTTRTPLWSTTLHLNPPRKFLCNAFLHAKTAPLGLTLATLRTLANSLLLQSTTRKSTPTSLDTAASASPGTTSGGGDTPLSARAFMYCTLDCSSGTMHTCLAPVLRAATAKPTLAAIGPP